MLASSVSNSPKHTLKRSSLSWQCLGQALWHATAFPLSFLDPREAGQHRVKLLGSAARNSWFPGEGEKLEAQRELGWGLFRHCCVCAGCPGLPRAPLKPPLSPLAQVRERRRRGAHRPCRRGFGGLSGAHIQTCSQGALWNSSGCNSLQTLKVSRSGPC